MVKGEACVYENKIPFGSQVVYTSDQALQSKFLIDLLQILYALIATALPSGIGEFLH